MITGSGAPARWRLTLSLICALLATGPGFSAGRGATLRGVVLGADGRPADQAVIVARHTSTRQVFRAEPATTEGAYSLEGLPPGYHEILVQHAGGAYLANRIIRMPSGGLVEISFRITNQGPGDGEWWSAAPDRSIEGLLQAPDGVARIVERAPRALATMPSSTASAGFWQVQGRWLIPALTLGTGAAVVYWIGEDRDDDDAESPFE